MHSVSAYRQPVAAFRAADQALTSGDQRVLEVASAAGLEFVTQRGGVLECSADIVEEHCETLATEQLCGSRGKHLPTG